MDFGFNLSEIKLLWTTAKRCELSNPVSIYVSADVLTKCISDIKNSAEVDDTINYSNTQKILSKLYDFKAKIDSVEDKKRGLESTKSLDVGQKLRIILPGKGVFYSEILSNGHDLIIKLPTQKDQIIVEGKDWVNQSVSVYLWRKEDARYVFDTSVQGCGIFLGKAAIFLKHSSNLIRTQKRNSIRAKCDINGMLYIIRSKIVDYNAVENSGGYRCKIEDISEKGALIRIAGKGLSIIGEFKKASPSHGTMNSKVDLTLRINQYNKAVDAISCLTEEDYFKGGVEYLKSIRSMSDLPIIRKDFIIEEYQVYEAKVIGADAILLIAAILDDDTFKRLYDLAYSLGLDVLCEVHDREEMERMVNLGVKIIGINNRNLKTFEVTLETTRKLSDMAPEGTVLVSESGVLTDEDIRVLKESNADALLIGTAFMESENPMELALHWKDIYNG